MNTLPFSPLFASCGDYLQLSDAADAGVNPMVLARAPTPGALAFEAFVLIGAVATFAVLYRRMQHFPLKAMATAAGVMVFEFFTAPMWRNEHLGPWAYVYHDVSWVLTVGWTALIMGTAALADALAARLARGEISLVSPDLQFAAAPAGEASAAIMPLAASLDVEAAAKCGGADDTARRASKGLAGSAGEVNSLTPLLARRANNADGSTGRSGDRTIPHSVLCEGPRFALTLLMLLPLVLVAENVLVALGIRSYSPEVQQVLSGYKIGLVPVEALYYVPVFTALVLAFAKYWGFIIDDAALVPVRRTHWLRALTLTILAVVLFELMIEPMVDNRNLPEWSYFYRDLSFLLTGLWVAMIAVVGILVQRFLALRSPPERFAAALVLIAVLALPVESWLINNGYRVYGPSATQNFCGVKTWLTGVPIEIAFAIPMYMALVFGFIRYWEIVGDNQL